MRRIRSFRHDSRGQALLEFALILPILLMLVLGIVEFGRVWNLAQLMSDVTREGARRSVIADNSITEQSVRDFMIAKLATGGVPASAITVTFLNCGTCATPWHGGEYQTVTVTIPYRFMFFGNVFGQIPLVSSFTMRTE